MPVNPLTAEDKAQIDRQLGNLADARDLVKRAKLAGLDVAAQETEIAELDKRLRSLDSAFFPTGSRPGR